MSGKEWSSCCGNSNVSNPPPEEWSVHAQLTFTQQAGNIVLSTSDGSTTRGDSGYGSERLGSPRSGFAGARATCSVTVAGHHTVTLTCSEIPEPPVQPQTQPQNFCFHPPHPPPEKQHFTPLFKDASSQTSTTQVPQVLQETKKPKFRQVARTSRIRGSPVANKSSGSDGKKTPRTVHIDVYCTASDSDSSDSIPSTPQTVFESKQVKVVHSRESDQLPHALQRQRRQLLSDSPSQISSAYPSGRSSLVSTFDEFSIPSESTLSASLANSSSRTTSWKDTDLESTRSLVDSFEYDNSFDRLRIKRKEKIWEERRNSRLESDSSSSSSESEGLAWSFGRYADLETKPGLKREDTVRRASNSQSSEVSVVKLPLKKSGSLSDSEISPKKPKAPPIFNHMLKAQKFGPIVPSLKKPGHHVGPSKNPDCSCDTCRYFFENLCPRNRTRSLCDPSK